MKRVYNNTVFTDHALERLKQRRIKQGDAWATINSPDRSRKAHRKGSWVFYRTWGNRKIEVVASKNDKKQWVVLSVWDKNVDERREQSYKKQQPIWKKVLKELVGIFRA